MKQKGRGKHVLIPLSNKPVANKRKWGFASMIERSPNHDRPANMRNSMLAEKTPNRPSASHASSICSDPI